MKSLSTAFKQVYGPELEKQGYVKMKGKHPYFVKVVGDEILHVITFEKRGTYYQGQKGYIPIGGIATVYRQRISLDQSPARNINWLTGNLTIWERQTPSMTLRTRSEMFNQLLIHCYPSDNEDAMIESLKVSLEKTKEYLLPTLNKVTDIKGCIEFYSQYKFSSMLAVAYKEDFNNKRMDNFYNEGLLFILNKSPEYYIEIKTGEYQKYLDGMASSIKEQWGGYKEASYQGACTRQESHNQKYIELGEKIFGDKEWMESAQEELERRKQENIERLKSWGLI